MDVGFRWVSFGLKSSHCIIGYQPKFGPTMSISTLRQVEDSAQCFAFAREGNIEGQRHCSAKRLPPREI